MSHNQCEINFDILVLNYASSIPVGCVTTYGGIAIALGYPGHQRRVGSILSKNPYPGVPCHRVIMSDGKIGAYFGDGSEEGKKRKAERLMSEGVPVNLTRKGYVVDMKTANIY